MQEGCQTAKRGAAAPERSRVRNSPTVGGRGFANCESRDRSAPRARGAPASRCDEEEKPEPEAGIRTGSGSRRTAAEVGLGRTAWPDLGIGVATAGIRRGRIEAGIRAAIWSRRWWGAAVFGRAGIRAGIWIGARLHCADRPVGHTLGRAERDGAALVHRAADAETRIGRADTGDTDLGGSAGDAGAGSVDTDVVEASLVFVETARRPATRIGAKPIDAQGGGGTAHLGAREDALALATEAPVAAVEVAAGIGDATGGGASLAGRAADRGAVVGVALASDAYFSRSTNGVDTRIDTAAIGTTLAVGARVYDAPGHTDAVGAEGLGLGRTLARHVAGAATVARVATSVAGT